MPSRRSTVAGAGERRAQVARPPLAGCPRHYNVDGRAALLLAHARRPNRWWHRLKTREFWTTPLEPPVWRTWVDAVLYLAVAVLVWVAAVREVGCGWR